MLPQLSYPTKRLMLPAARTAVLAERDYRQVYSFELLATVVYILFHELGVLGPFLQVISDMQLVSYMI